MAQGLVVQVLNSLNFDAGTGKFVVTWTAVGDDENQVTGTTNFEADEHRASINAKVCSDAKALFNSTFGTDFNHRTPVQLLGGLV